MVVKRRKKVTKRRGSRTHGWGLVHRGSGQRGGSGHAGFYQAKKPSIWKERRYGKVGFKPKGPQPHEAPINLKTVEQNLPLLIDAKHAKEEKGTYTINLT